MISATLASLGLVVALAVAPGAPAPPAVTGYVDGGTSNARVAKSAGALTTLAVAGVQLTPNGRAVSRPSASELRLLRAAHDRGLRAELLVGNYDNRIGDFSRELAHRTLGSAANTRAAVASIVRVVERDGWDGITVDLESLERADAAGLSRFMTLLNEKLGPDRSLAICLQATPDGYGALGYRLGSLAASADRLVLMAYDQHGPGWSGPGPVASEGWVRASLASLLRTVPASKVELGIAGYGYRWGPRSGAVSDAAARDLAGDRAVWSEKHREWRATLADGTKLWWSDERTYTSRYALARELGLAGVAVWSLRLSDPIQSQATPR